MALTKVTGPLVSGSTNNLGDYTVNNITGVAATFSGNLSVGGTITYQDVTSIDSVGIITAQAGIHLGIGATTGKIDIATGISTFTQVGIGTNNPQAPLEVYRDGAGLAGLIQVTQDGTGDAAIDFQLKGTREYTLGIDNSDSDKFKLSGNAGLDNNTLLTITNAGLVGIGTANPSHELHVFGTIKISNDDSGTIESNAIRTTEDGKLQFLRNDPNNDTPTITIDDAAGGYVGIGLTDPTVPLVVSSSENTLGILTSTDDGANLDLFDNDTQSRIRTVNGGLHLYADLANAVADSAIRFFVDGSNEKLRITSAGNVGIGTDNPNVSLEILNDTPRLRLSDNNSNAGTNSYTQLTNINGNSYIYSRANSANGVLLIGGHGGGTFDEHLRITSGGRVGINTTNGISAPLHVAHADGGFDDTPYNKAAIFGSQGWITDTRYHYTDATIFISGRNNAGIDTGAGIEFTTRTTGDNNWLHGAFTMGRDGHFKLLTGGAGVVEGTEKLRINTSGNVGLGTAATITHRLHTYGTGNSGGVRFENSHDTTTVSGNTASGAFPHNILISNYSGGGSASDRMASIGFDITTASAHANATIAYQATDGAGNGDLQFWLEEDNTIKERLRINSDGYLLAGHNTRDANLAHGTAGRMQLWGTSWANAGIALVNTQASTDPAFLTFAKSRKATASASATVVVDGDRLGEIRFAGDDGTDMHSYAASIAAYASGTIAGNRMPGKLVFATTNDAAGAVNSSTRMVLYSNGKIDLGTGAVNIAKFCQSDNNHQIVGQASNNVAALDVYSQHGNDGNRLSFAVSDNRTGSKSNAFVVKGNGRVGIGSDVPDTLLDVYGGSTSIQVGNQSGSGRFGADGSNTKIGSYSNHNLQLITGNSTRVTIVQAGTSGEAMRISGVGVTVQSSLTPNFEVRTTAGSGQDCKITLKGARTSSSTSSIAMIRFVNATSSSYTMGEIVGMDPAGAHASQIGDLVFRTTHNNTTTEVARFTGGATAAGRNLKFADGSGIDFSATTNSPGANSDTTSEVLNDYERGTFDFKLEDANSGSDTLKMHYVKVGSVVHCYGPFRGTEGSTASVYWALSNTADSNLTTTCELPFVPVDSGACESPIYRNIETRESTPRNPSDGDTMPVLGWQAGDSTCRLTDTRTEKSYNAYTGGDTMRKADTRTNIVLHFNFCYVTNT